MERSISGGRGGGRRRSNVCMRCNAELNKTHLHVCLGERLGGCPQVIFHEKREHIFGKKISSVLLVPIYWSHGFIYPDRK